MARRKRAKDHRKLHTRFFRARNGHMSLEPCADLRSTCWLVDQSTPWGQGISPAPGGFTSYARIRFIPDPEFFGQSSVGANLPDRILSDKEKIEIALKILYKYTQTSEECYYAMWDGWGTDGINRNTPKMHLPDRDYWILRGNIEDFSSWNAIDPIVWPYGLAPNPAFVWPADRAWAITYDVDDHYAIVSADEGAIQEIVANKRLDGVRVAPEEQLPYWD